eukprot:comp11993_c0_seq1/m.6686 comp11993_c0_seq1/g.6686  ORF comp11993_c0_seq1/g.6686 comp11993_c0_seq1/m.6686 type:complete len:871 (-) comp11993_c0_seq1:176-2788(-)
MDPFSSGQEVTIIGSDKPGPGDLTSVPDNLDDKELTQENLSPKDAAAAHGGFEKGTFQRTTMRVKKPNTRPLKKKSSKGLPSSELKMLREKDRALVNKLGNMAFDAEIRQFLADGKMHAGTLMDATRRKLLEYPPLRNEDTKFEESLNDVLADLPELIRSYNRATGRDFTKKLRKMVVGNLTLVIVPEISEELAGQLVSSMDDLALDAATEHNYYQRELLAVISLLLSGMETDGGVESFANRIRAYHQLSELPKIYRKCFDGLRRMMLHSLMKLGQDQTQIARLRRVYSITPRTAIIGLLKLKSGKKALSGFASLLLQKFGSQTLLQRIVYSHMDVAAVEAQRDQNMRLCANRNSAQLLVEYIGDRYPLPMGWMTFDSLEKIKACLVEQVVRPSNSKKPSSTGRRSFTQSHSPRASGSHNASPSSSQTGSDDGRGEVPLGESLAVPTDKGKEAVGLDGKSRSSSFSADSRMTMEDIYALPDMEGARLFYVAERELARRDQMAFVDFVGSPAINKFLEKMLSSLAGPLSEATHSGGIGEMANAMFDLFEHALEILGDKNMNDISKRVRLNEELKVFMEACYVFLHNAITQDRGHFMETLEWLLCSYYKNNTPFSMEELLGGLDPADAEKVWAEIDALLEHQKSKTGSRDETPKPPMETVEKLLPKFREMLTRQLQPVPKEMMDKMRDDPDLIRMTSAKVVGNVPQDENAPKVVTHLEVAHSEEANQTLHLQGFNPSCDLTRGRMMGESVYILHKKSKLHTDAINPITDLAISTDDTQVKRLQLGGYIKVPRDINKGSMLSNKISLWYKRGDPDNGTIDPIDDIVVVSGDRRPQGKYHRLSQNLSTSTFGRDYYLWYRKLSEGPQQARTSFS